MIDYSKVLNSRISAVPPSGIRKFFDLLEEMPDAISLGIGEPDFPTPWHIRDAGIYSLEKGFTKYSPNAGFSELRRQIARYLQRRFDLRYDPRSEILVTVGGSEGLDLALRCILEPGDEVIIPTPSFVCYGPLVSMSMGVPVYVDSVVIERNRFLNRLGLIAAEDSTYWVVAPTEAGWKKAWQEAEQYFQYDEKMLKRDSLQHYWTTYALLSDAVYNMTDQKSVDDSLISVPYNRLKPEYHVFYKPFAEGGVLSQATPVACSNGVLYKTQEWPFTPEQTYFKELWSEGEQTSLITNYRACTYNTRRLATDSISEGAYLDIVPESGTSNWEVTFRVNNTLSGTYDICAVVLPKSVANQKDPDLKPNKFRAYVNYVDEKGAEQVFNCNNKEFTNKPELVDTIVLAEAFHFPACNYDQQDIKVSVRLQCSITARQTSQYAREMYLDCIYLRPRTSKSE